MLRSANWLSHLAKTTPSKKEAVNGCGGEIGGVPGHINQTWPLTFGKLEMAQNKRTQDKEKLTGFFSRKCEWTEHSWIFFNKIITDCVEKWPVGGTMVRSYISHISVLYQLYISHVSVLYQSCTSHISGIYQSYIIVVHCCALLFGCWDRSEQSTDAYIWGHHHQLDDHHRNPNINNKDYLVDN